MYRRWLWNEIYLCGFCDIIFFKWIERHLCLISSSPAVFLFYEISPLAFWMCWFCYYPSLSISVFSRWNLSTNSKSFLSSLCINYLAQRLKYLTIRQSWSLDTFYARTVNARGKGGKEGSTAIWPFPSGVWGLVFGWVFFWGIEWVFFQEGTSLMSWELIPYIIVFLDLSIFLKTPSWYFK